MTDNKLWKPKPFAAASCAILASVLLLGCPVLPAADASGQSLHGQIRDGVEGRLLACGDPGHVLVVRPSLRLACVIPESSQRLGWPEAAFTGDNDMVVNSTLGVELGEETFHVGYVLRNGAVGGHGAIPREPCC